MSIAVQVATDEPALPSAAELRQWARAAGAHKGVTIRIVNEAESAALNGQYRSKHGATNVLSFPASGDELPAVLQTELGDVVICAPVVLREATEQHKPATAHWAHMVVHGILHLRGYDHIEPGEAERMEALEAEILGELGFDDPYS